MDKIAKTKRAMRLQEWSEMYRHTKQAAKQYRRGAKNKNYRPKPFITDCGKSVNQRWNVRKSTRLYRFHHHLVLYKRTIYHA